MQLQATKRKTSDKLQVQQQGIFIKVMAEGDNIQCFSHIICGFLDNGTSSILEISWYRVCQISS